MSFCCSNFEGAFLVRNQFGINIRIVKFNSKELTNNNFIFFFRNTEVNKTRNKRNDIRFFMTMGYEKFNLHLPMVNIIFCPFCGINLYDFYLDEKYANEIEGKTFNL